VQRRKGERRKMNGMKEKTKGKKIMKFVYNEKE
jgi:hypothetical protein